MNAREGEPHEIVLIDDEPAIVSTLSRVLSTRPGARLVGFTESAAALQWLRAHTPALVITDHGMPGPDGFDLARAVRAQPHTSRVPILMLTGMLDGGLEQEAAAAGVNALVLKPVTMRDLLMQVERLLPSPELP